jgi:hypothetical protein
METDSVSETLYSFVFLRIFDIAKAQKANNPDHT